MPYSKKTKSKLKKVVGLPQTVKLFLCVVMKPIRVVSIHIA